MSTLLFLILSFFLLFQVAKMKMVFSIEDLAGQGLTSADELHDLKESFDDGITSQFVLTPLNGEFSTDELCKIRTWYSYLRIMIPELKNMQSSFDFSKVFQSNEGRIGYRNLIDLDCLQTIQTNSNDEIKNELINSPFGLAQNKSEKLNIFFNFTFFDSLTSKFGAFNPELIQSLRNSVTSDLQKQVPNSNVMWMGPADYQWYVLEGVKFAKYINLLMLIVILFGLRIAFGKWSAGVFYALSLLFTIIWVFGLKGLFGSSYDALSSGLFLIIGISSLEDFVFICFEEYKGNSWKKSIQNMILPSFYTSLTTMIGFLSLYVSDVEAIKRMGLWSSIGALVEWIVLFVFFPCLLKNFKTFKGWTDPKRKSLAQYLRQVSTRSIPKSIGLFCLLTYFLAFLFYNNINFNVSPIDTFPKTHEYHKAFDFLKKDKDWEGVVSLLFAEKVSLQESKEIRNKLINNSYFNTQVSHVEDISKIAEWLSKGNYISPDEAHFQLKYNAVYKHFVSDDKSRALIYVRDSSVEVIEKLQTITKSLCQGKCHLAGEIIAFSDFSNLVSKTLLESLFISLIIVGLIISWLAFSMNKKKWIINLLISSFWGPMTMIFILGAFGIAIDFWKSIFASILVGLTGDNAVQYLFASKKNDIQTGINSRGGASIITGVLMSIVSLIYLGSYFNSPRAFGLILCTGLLISLIGDLWLLNGLLNKKNSN